MVGIREMETSELLEELEEKFKQITKHKTHQESISGPVFDARIEYRRIRLKLFLLKCLAWCSRKVGLRKLTGVFLHKHLLVSERYIDKVKGLTWIVIEETSAKSTQLQLSHEAIQYVIELNRRQAATLDPIWKNSRKIHEMITEIARMQIE